MINRRVLIGSDGTGPRRRVGGRVGAGVLAVGLLAAACGGGGAESAEVTPAEAGIARTLDGRSVDVREYAGSDLVLWFWAPW